MKKIVICFLLTIAPSFASEISDYFNSFYCNYLEQRGVSLNFRENLDILFNITNSKVLAIENYMLNSKDCDRVEYGANLLEEEYLELINNIEFELNYIPNCPLSKKSEKHFKKAHKKFMRQIEKNYCDP